MMRQRSSPRIRSVTSAPASQSRWYSNNTASRRIGNAFGATKPWTLWSMSPKFPTASATALSAEVAFLPSQQLRRTSLTEIQRLIRSNVAWLSTKEPKQVSVPPIPRDKIEVTFSTSSGPGGQNVNKVNTKAEIRFNPATLDWLPGGVLARFQASTSNLANKDGEVVISSQRFRTQKDNLEDCFAKLQEFVDEAAIVPKEREETVVPEYAKEERLKRKKERSDVKKHRGKERSDDWD